MARRPARMSGGGPPSPIVSFAELGRQNEARRAAVKARGAVKAKNLSRRSPSNDVGRMIRDHLQSNSNAQWHLKVERPRTYWDRRFKLRPDDDVTYGDMYEAMLAMDDDEDLNAAMEGRTMTAFIRVYDQITEQEHYLRLAAHANWNRAMFDMGDKLQEWSAKYGTNTDQPTQVLQVIMLIGPPK